MFNANHQILAFATATHRAKITLILLMVCLDFAPVHGLEQATPLAEFTRHLDDQRTTLIEIRRDIHRHPEPSGEEERTARVVAAYLESLGFAVRTGVGGHGVLALLEGDRPGPVIAFRADMDAVRSGADDPMEFRSEVAGVNHICGHDVHTAVGLALAAGFSGIRESLAGTVLLIFQPAEEAATGARAMLNDGAFAQLLPDAIFAYHTAPFEVGLVVGTTKTLLPGRDAVRVEIRGEGDLGETAHGIRQLLLECATEGSDEPTRPVGDNFVRVSGARTVQDNDGWNVRATFTTASRKASGQARSQIEASLAEFERNGLELELTYRERFIAGVENDSLLVEQADAAMKTVLGEHAVLRTQSVVTQFSEDFGSFQEQVPGAMYFLGVSNTAKGWFGMPHTPTFVADEEAIFVGAKAMAAVFLDLFADSVSSKP
jgi:metal-dependent amidase/aminoacylase/carboxypeptidase family protein